MRICFLGDAGSIHLQRWISYFIKAGHEVDIISFNSCPIEGPAVHLLANGHTGRLAYIWSLFRIRGLIRKIKPDLLHAHYATSFGLLAIISGFHPLVVSAWGSDVLIAPKQSALLRLAVEQVLRRADALTSDSSYMSGRMIELLKGQAKILKTVTMGVSREWFSSIPDTPKNDLQILSLRGHQVIYNIDIILRSMVEVLEEVPEASLVVAGEGPETSSLKALARSLGILENVNFVGQLPHAKVQDYLNQSSISVSVPSSDATAVSLLETMACGSFPVVSDLPANREWVEDSVNGLIVGIRNTAELSRALIRCLQDRALRQDAIELNRQKIIAKAIWENNMAEMEELYWELRHRVARSSADKRISKRLCLMANAASSHTEKWATELARRGWKVDIISFIPAEIPNVTIHVVPRLLSGRTEFVFLRQSWVYEIVRNLQPDIVHAHYATSFGFLGAVAAVHPLIISAWGSDIFSFPKVSFLHRYLLEQILNKADVLCSTSRIMAEEMQKYLKTQRLVEVIPFGVDIERFSPPERVNSGTDSPVVFGVAKYLQPVYGLDILIKAFALLEERCPGRALLRIAGDGSEKRKLRNLSVRLGIAHLVEWIGVIPNYEVAALYKNLDVVVVPSRQESFGVTAVEGSACGCPIIASRVGGLPEVVIDGETGLLIPPENTKELCSAMEFMIAYPEKRRLMGQAGRKLVMEYYDWQRNVTQMEEVYNKFLNQESEVRNQKSEARSQESE
ncbi:MAG TPA: glycosyltransferase [Desulfitobacteriaceae bacterium]|nr:glycosyltransferase [Desulfitobacteriaceae bacterium]